MESSNKGSRKAINFDLDTNKLKKIYPAGEENYTMAYEDIKKFFKSNGFEHRQGSGYTSIEKMSNVSIYDLVEQMKESMPWLVFCLKTIDVTNIGKVHDLKSLFATENKAQKIRKQRIRDTSYDMEP